jgi:hypothetical protein
MEEEKKEECKTCNKGLNVSQKSMVVLSVYILISGIYGTYKFIENIINLF